MTREADLPRVPLPTLERACETFLEWCGPLLDAAQFEETERSVAALLEGPGPRLQAALEAYDDDPSTDSWLDEFWRDRYLGRRDPIAINANFFFVLEDLPADGEDPQLARAGELLHRTADLARRLANDEVARPADTSTRQLDELFGTTRIPGEVRDTVRAVPVGSTGDDGPRHVVVWHRGHGWTLDVLDADGTPYSGPALTRALTALVDSVEADEPHPVGVLTTARRAVWAGDRDALLALPGNREALDRLETALCCLALDPARPTSIEEAGHTLLAGSGRDRWFDKSLTLVVLGDGTCGLNSEHCLLDGTAVLAFAEDVYDEHDRPSADGQPVSAALTFALDDPLRERVEQAAEEFVAFGRRTALSHVPVEGLSREGAKALGCSPDAFFQLALQVAQVRARGAVGATYESIATRRWRSGRTEAMRVVTPELVAFTAALDDPELDDDARRSAFASAAAAHVARAKACQAGDAPEQHLWELLRIQARRGDELGVPDEPALFTSPGWTVMREDALSTSSVVSRRVRSWGFGATSPTCIGVAYALMPDSAYVCLSTPTDVAEQMEGLATELQRAVADLTDLLSAG